MYKLTHRVTIIVDGKEFVLVGKDAEETANNLKRILLEAETANT